jgi:hypothetical protein
MSVRGSCELFPSVGINPGPRAIAGAQSVRRRKPRGWCLFVPAPSKVIGLYRAWTAQPSIKSPLAAIQLPATRTAIRAHRAEGGADRRDPPTNTTETSRGAPAQLNCPISLPQVSARQVEQPMARGHAGGRVCVGGQQSTQDQNTDAEDRAPPLVAENVFPVTAQQPGC